MKVSAVIAAVLALSACKGKHAGHQTRTDDQAGSSASAGSANNAPEMQTPEVHGPGVEAVKALSATIHYGATRIGVGDSTVCEVGSDGGMDPGCVQRLIHVLEGTVRSDDPIGLELNKSLPYFRVQLLMSQLEAAGFHAFALLAGDGKSMVPIATPDPSQSGLRLVLTVNSGSVDLWSLSGQEGTRRKPKLHALLAADLTPISNALAEIVKRRWPSGARAAEDRAIILQVDRMQNIETLLRVIAAVRASDRGELFPTIQLAGGI